VYYEKNDKKLTTNDQMKNGLLSFQSRYESWRSICDKFFITRQKVPLWFIIIGLQWHDACSYKLSIWFVNFQLSVLNWHAGLNAILNKTIPISSRMKVFFIFFLFYRRWMNVTLQYENYIFHKYMIMKLDSH
jgi:hypothetical protein